MVRLAVWVLLFAMSTANIARAESGDSNREFSFKQDDKQLHMVASCGLALVSTAVCRATDGTRAECILIGSVLARPR